MKNLNYEGIVYIIHHPSDYLTIHETKVDHSATPTLKSLPYPLPYLVTYIRSDRKLGSSLISLLSASKGANSAKVRSQLFPY